MVTALRLSAITKQQYAEREIFNMALQSRTITVGADKDVNNGGKNYASGQVIYIKNEAGVLAPIFRDIDGQDPIAQNTISNVTNAKGQFTFFVEEGNYTAEYNDQSTPLFVFGADYFNNQIDFVTNQILSNTQPYSAGNFTDGFTFTELNQYGNATVNDGGTDYATTFWYIGGTLPHTVAPLTDPRNFPLLYQQRDFNSAEFVATKTTENAQDFIDSFALKIFQSPTDGLTKINTRTLLGGEVYEVRKVSDGSFADIYTDKEGLNPIDQNGSSNVSGSNGVIELFVLGQDYYITVNGVRVDFETSHTLTPFDFGASKNPAVDSGDALFKYWQYCLSNGLTFDISGGHEFLVTGVNYTDGSVKSYFQTEEVDDVTVVFGTSKIKIVPPDGQAQANLFDVKQTNGFKFDSINFEVDVDKATAGENVRTMIIRNGFVSGSNDVKGSFVKAKNAEGVQFTTDLDDYTLNGFNSVYRSKGLRILDMKIDNSDMPFTFANEYTGYGLTCQNSGDDCVIDNLVVNNIHRAVFVYGAKGVYINGGKVTQSNATTVNLGAYGSVEDCEIKLELVQNTNLATDLVRIRPNEIGTSGGDSLDLDGGRTHFMKNITLDLIEGGNATSVQSGLEVNKSAGDGSDSDISFENITIKLQSNFPNISRGMTIFDKAKAQNSSSMSVADFKIIDTRCSSNCRISLLESAVGNIVVKDSYFSRSVICEYGSAASTTPNEDSWIIFDNTQVGFTVSETGDYDVPVQFVNGSKVATVINSANKVPPQNKIFLNSHIGTRFFSNKPRWGVYTNIDNSNAMYNPSNPTSNLIGGSSSFGSEATPKFTDVIAPSDNTTSDVGEIFHEYFFNNSVWGATKGNSVDIYIKKDGTSEYAIAQGYLLSEGISTKDFQAGKFKLKVFNVINTGVTEVFSPEDFSVSVEDANTLRFSCAIEAEDMAVSIYDS